METKPMKILIVEDDPNDYNSFIECTKKRKDIEIVAITDSENEALKLVKNKHPEGIVLDLELNNSISGGLNSLEFLSSLKKINLNYDPIVIVTTHINSKTTYDLLHRNGVAIILYKDNPIYSSEHVLNNFISLRKTNIECKPTSIQELLDNEEKKIARIIDNELNLIGITANLKGKQYMHDAILYLIQNEQGGNDLNEYLTKKYKRSYTTINNVIKNTIIHAWKVTPIEDLEQYYTARIDYRTGIPTTMQLIYYYVEKIKKMI